MEVANNLGFVIWDGEMVIEKMLQKMRSFWLWLLGLSFFGQVLPLILTFLLFVALGFHIYFEISGTACEVVPIEIEYLTTIECERDSFFLKKLIDVISSGDTRNLGLLLAASISWFFFHWRAKSADQNTKTSKQTLIVERITRAIEQLAHEKPSVRLGGILGLEQVALAQQEEHEKIIRILVSFIRTRARKESQEVKKDLAKIDLLKLTDTDDYKAYREQRLDVESAVGVLANIASKIKITGQSQEQYNELKHRLCNLEDIDLRGLALRGIDLSNFNLRGIDFSGASLSFTNFTGANLSLFYSVYTKKEDITKFVEAHLFGTNFSHTNLSGVDFSQSLLYDAVFNNADLSHTIFKNSYIDGARFETSKNLTQEQIDKTLRHTSNHPPVLPKGLESPSFGG